MSSVAPPVAPRRALDVPLGTPTRPSWRGRLHVLGLVTALPLIVVLAVLADGARARAGVIVYGVGLCSMLTVSATYHRWVQTIRARRIWRRADHATIFAAIAGTFTPVCLLTVGTAGTVAWLITAWGLALVGAMLKISGHPGANRVATGLYLGIGWLGLLLVPTLWRRAGIAPVTLLVAGGVLYTVGAIAFGRQWPRLRPSVFSYHEVWHSFTLLAAGTHMAAIWVLAT